jgi:homocitrate synthase NifV
MKEKVGPVLFLDTTLRDGEQQPGICFSSEGRLRIASFLDLAGVQEVELGIPAAGKYESQVIAEIVRSGFSFKSVVWSRAVAADIWKSAATGATRVHISVPVSNVHLHAMQKCGAWVMQSLQEVLPIAKDCFQEVSVGLQDASRAQKGIIAKIVELAQKEGVYRLRYADTVGLQTPFDAYNSIHKLVKKHPEIEWEYHGHNDLGMATANAWSAYVAGAKCINVTLGGIGERAGNTALEELAVTIKSRSAKFCPVHTEVFHEIPDLLRTTAGVYTSVSKAITGENCFVHKSGIHQNLLLKNPQSYQSIKHEDTGVAGMRFVISKLSGRNAIKQALMKCGIECDLDTLELFVDDLKQYSAQNRLQWEETEMGSVYKDWKKGNLKKRIA